MTRDKMIDLLEKAFPKLKTRYSELFDGTKERIVTGEGSEMPDGMPAFDYWSQDYKEITYIMGVHKDLVAFLDKYDWYAEAHDAGTYFLGPQ